VHVDLRHLHREGADHAVGGRQRCEVAHQAHVGGGAAHVVGDEVAHAGGAADAYSTLMGRLLQVNRLNRAADGAQEGSRAASSIVLP